MKTLSKSSCNHPQWIEENLGIKERRIAGENEFTSDLAANASKGN
jgi:3-oxoacyl-[acyl-carrier-protein] synthase III